MKSLLRSPNEPLVCYCPPGMCQAPYPFRGPCRRATDVVAEGNAEYDSWVVTCHHSWDGPWATFEGGRGETITCSKCGMTAFAYSMTLGL